MHYVLTDIQGHTVLSSFSRVAFQSGTSSTFVLPADFPWTWQG